MSHRKLTVARIAASSIMGLFILASSGVTAQNWNLVWHDEFNGTTLDRNHWTFDVGGGYLSGGTVVKGWGNNELQYYTRTNASVSDGVLHIRALKESTYPCYNYTSARLKTAGLFYRKYGR